MTTPRRTALFGSHVAANGKLVDFSGWELPVNYGSQIEEHHAVRSGAGVFDVSHMTIIDFSGSNAQQFLSTLLANNITRLNSPGQAMYSCMLNEQGGVIDDLIAYFMGENSYRLIVNSATKQKDLAWIQKNILEQVEYKERSELALLAVQGPKAAELLSGVLSGKAVESLKSLENFNATQVDGMFIARTGYTGEDGFEIALDADKASELWSRLMDAGIAPCGLGARDTLRLESAMNLYGHDMDESVSPIECGLAWTVALDPSSRQFTGRDKLESLKAAGRYRKRIGLVLEGRGILREGQSVLHDGSEVGVITSGTFSPTLQQSIAMARVDPFSGSACEVDIRGKPQAAKVAALPFYKRT